MKPNCCYIHVLRRTPEAISVSLGFFSCIFFQQPQTQPQPIRIIPSQSAQPTSLPKPVPSVQHAVRPPRPPHTPHAASLPTCPGRGKMAKFLSPDEMTSRDYYFDSYAHFGIHEVVKCNSFCEILALFCHFSNIGTKSNIAVIKPTT